MLLYCILVKSGATGGLPWPNRRLYTCTTPFDPHIIPLPTTNASRFYSLFPKNLPPPLPNIVKSLSYKLFLDHSSPTCPCVLISESRVEWWALPPGSDGSPPPSTPQVASGALSRLHRSNNPSLNVLKCKGDRLPLTDSVYDRMMLSTWKDLWGQHWDSGGE